MQVLSIQVGKVQKHNHQGETWTSGYKKLPISGRVYAGKINIEGDQQHNTRVHGGEHRAVLMYGAAHYDFWQQQLGHRLPYGSFAENLTVSDILEDTACLGDIYQVGDDVRLQVSQPRLPCDQIYKALGIDGIYERVRETMRSGWYLRVLQEGYIEAGMPVRLLDRPHPAWTVARTHGVMIASKDRAEEALELSDIPEFEPEWRQRLKRIVKAHAVE